MDRNLKPNTKAKKARHVPPQAAWQLAREAVELAMSFERSPTPQMAEVISALRLRMDELKTENAERLSEALMCESVGWLSETYRKVRNKEITREQSEDLIKEYFIALQKTGSTSLAHALLKSGYQCSPLAVRKLGFSMDL